MTGWRIAMNGFRWVDRRWWQLSVVLVTLGMGVAAGVLLWEAVAFGQTSVCGEEAYNPSTEGCCGGVIYELNSEGCCGGVIYDLGTEDCCDDQIYDVFDDSVCCCCTSCDEPPDLDEGYELCSPCDFEDEE